MDVPLILIPFTSFKAIYSRARGHKVENDKTVLILYNEKNKPQKVPNSLFELKLLMKNFSKNCTKNHGKFVKASWEEKKTEE